MSFGKVQATDTYLHHRNSALEQKLLGWGWNEHGNMGLKHTEDVMSPTLISIPSISTPTTIDADPPKIAGIWAGCGTSWVAMETKPDNGSGSSVFRTRPDPSCA